MATTRLNQMRAKAGLLGGIHHDTLKSKRGLEAGSPEKNNQKKRQAFGDITNAHKNKALQSKKGGKDVKKSVGGKKKVEVLVPVHSSSQPDSNLGYDIIELSQPDSSLPSSDEVQQLNERNSQQMQDEREEEQMEVQDWDDVDEENMNDPHQAALYAAFIFEYYKEKEGQFVLGDYMQRQPDLTANMRSILVDWLVEVQENFELNHETLYLAVKLVDQYLSKKAVKKDKLQLLGATCLFISCKFDERCPPVLDDFLYICDDAYNREELLEMERTVLRTVDFYLGMPLSYRFLRRYAKCCRAAIETLTLGRYILEMSLMHYEYVVKYRESEMAAAALWLAMKMRKAGDWTPTLVHYSGYVEKDLMKLVQMLNFMVSAPPNKQLTTIRSKYSHQVFHQVAKTSPLSSSELAAHMPEELL